jgi:hypothetical protein
MGRAQPPGSSSFSAATGYSTLVLHNAFAVGGVVQALGDGGVTTNLPVCSFR